MTILTKSAFAFLWRFSKILTILLLTTHLSSCFQLGDEDEKRWDVKTSEPQLVVDCDITSEFKRHTISLLESSNYFDNGAPIAVEDAKVVVFSGETRIEFLATAENRGYYVSENEFSVQSNEKYKLDIQTKLPYRGRHQFTSECISKPMFRFDSITATSKEPYILTIDADSADMQLTVYLYGEDNEADKANYYYFEYRNEKLANNSPLEKYRLISNRLNGTNLNIRDHDYKYVDAFIDKLNTGDTLEVRLHAVTREYYLYLRTVYGQITSSDPVGFLGHSANALSNIEGALGFFYVSNYSVSECVIK